MWIEGEEGQIPPPSEGEEERDGYQSDSLQTSKCESERWEDGDRRDWWHQRERERESGMKSVLRHCHLDYGRSDTVDQSITSFQRGFSTTRSVRVQIRWRSIGIISFVRGIHQSHQEGDWTLIDSPPLPPSSLILISIVRLSISLTVPACKLMLDFVATYIYSYHLYSSFSLNAILRFHIVVSYLLFFIFRRLQKLHCVILGMVWLLIRDILCSLSLLLRLPNKNPFHLPSPHYSS